MLILVDHLVLVLVDLSVVLLKDKFIMLAMVDLFSVAELSE